MRTFTVIVFLAFSIPVFSQNGGISGRLIPKGGRFDFAGSEIQLFRNGRLVECMTADQCGDFQNNSITPGIYKVRLLIHGKITYEDLIVINESRTEQLNLSDAGAKLCPKGHSDSQIPIAYGLPGEELMRRADRGEVRLGGCIVTKSKRYCKTHKIEF